VIDAARTPGFLLFLAVLAVFGSARLAELAVSRRHATRAAARGARAEPERVFPAMVALHTIPFWMGPLEVLACHRPFIPALAGTSIAALVGVGALRLWALRALGETWNVRIVRPPTVVRSGPYAFVRHPNYAAVVLELLFLPLVHTAVVTAAIVSAANAAVLARRIDAEEAMLGSVAGYAEAMGAKPRFVPAFRGRRPHGIERSR
jgi:methyltransferase